MLRDTVRAAINRSPLIARAYLTVRARLQERAAEQARRQLIGEAATRGISASSQDETAAALRARLAARVEQNGWPRRKGDLHIFLTFGLRDWEVVLPDAFKLFGDVTVFEWISQDFAPAQLGSNWWQRRRAMNQKMLAAFFECHSRRPVDVVVGYLSGLVVDPSVLAPMNRAGAAIFNFSYDEKLAGGSLPDGTIRGPAALASVVDLTVTNDPGPGLKYVLEGGLTLFNPQGADPLVHRPYNVPFRYDVTFIGARFGYRPFLIQSLQNMGVNATAFGRGWPNGALPIEKMVEMYSLSRINLGFGGIGHSRTMMCLKGRDFEVPMSGGLYLTEHNPELACVFDIGREIVTYTDHADCAEKIRSLLADQPKAAAIRKAGRDRCLRDHTWEARWTRVFQLAGII